MFKDEDAVQADARLEFSRSGIMIWRNNVGACRDQTGRLIRYGLANESKRINEKIKSSDLIGIQPIVIQPHHVGMVFGRFIAGECKRSDWKGVRDDHERAQERFHQIVRQYGGAASFIASDDDVRAFLL